MPARAALFRRRRELCENNSAQLCGAWVVHSCCIRVRRRGLRRLQMHLEESGGVNEPAACARSISDSKKQMQTCLCLTLAG